MHRILTAAAALIVMGGAAGAALAQPHDDHHGHAMMARKGPVQHNWRTGGRIENSDWNRGAHVDYRSHHLRAPPRGYEWRQVDGNYVLAAAATGLIASVIAASH